MTDAENESPVRKALRERLSLVSFETSFYCFDVRNADVFLVVVGRSLAEIGEARDRDSQPAVGTRTAARTRASRLDRGTLVRFCSLFLCVCACVAASLLLIALHLVVCVAFASLVERRLCAAPIARLALRRECRSGDFAFRCQTSVRSVDFVRFPARRANVRSDVVVRRRALAPPPVRRCRS